MLSLLAVAGAASAVTTPPITLRAEREAARIRIEVVGESAAPLSARYSLEARSGTGNRSTQHGNVTLRPGQRVVLMTLGLGQPDAGWSAVLTVSGAGPEYRQELGSARDEGPACP